MAEEASEVSGGREAGRGGARPAHGTYIHACTHKRRQTRTVHRDTHRPTTVTLSAHARRGLITGIVTQAFGYSPCQLNNCSESERGYEYINQEC